MQMYVPQRNVGDEKEMIAFARANSLVSLVTAPGGALTATHLPCVLSSEVDGSLVLYAHMAKANPQWRAFDGSLEAMAIFTGPHAYISPFFYQNEVSVPTWNYVAVHMHGKPTVVDSKEGKIAVLRKLITANDEKYLARFENLPSSYLDNMLSGIAAFSMKVDRINGRFKLSQDKSLIDRSAVIGGLLKEATGPAHDTGVLMQRALESVKEPAHPLV